MRTPRRAHREVAMVPLAGTCLAPALSSLAVVDEAILPGVRFPVDHRSCQLCAVASGTMRYHRPRSAAGPAGEMRFTAGALIAQSAGRWAVEIPGPAPFHGRYALLDGPLAERLEADLAHLGGCLDDRQPPAAALGAVQLLVRTCLERAPGWDWRALAALAQVAAHVSLVCERGGGSLVERLGRLVDGAPEEPWRLARAAAVIGLPETVFIHRFRAETGEGPASWIRRRRMEHARGRLALGERPAAVAAALGFPSLAQFSRTFKTTLGSRPSDHARD